MNEIPEEVLKNTAEEPIDEAMLAELEADAGKGILLDPHFKILLIVRLLQSGSREVESRGPRYILNATAGDFVFRGAERELVRGEEGFVFWPIYFHHVYVEWRPDRGGFVTMHAELPSTAKEVSQTNERGEKRIVTKLPNGNIVEETVYCYGVDQYKLEWVIPFRAGSLFAFKQFNDLLGKLRFTHETPAGPVHTKLPMWGSMWRITSTEISWNKYSWFSYKFDLLARFGDGSGIISKAAYQQGKALHNLLVERQQQMLTFEPPEIDEEPNSANSVTEPKDSDIPF
jgi:hypothetical protein